MQKSINELDTHITMKELPISERPYEKLHKFGPQSLSDAELLGIIFRSGTRNERAAEIAQRVLCLEHKSAGLPGLYHISIEELQQIKGIGFVKAIQVKAVMELCQRISKQQAGQKFQVTSPQSIASIYMGEMRHLRQECFKVVFLDTKNHIMGDLDITIGSINASIVHPREVFREAIRKSAANIIMLHNHPSGDPTPSREDIHVTTRIQEAGKIIGIEVLDHIIIGNGVYISFKEKAML